MSTPQIKSKDVLSKIERGKRVPKYDMAWEIDQTPGRAWNWICPMIEHYTREEIVTEFNKIFKTDIK
jgi:hypothetical protein